MDNQENDIKIIVVDDEKNIRRSIQLILEAEKYHVLVFQDAIKAFEAMQSESFDVALVDIKMEGIDGLQLFQKMRECGISVPVIFMSGNASLSEAAQAVKSGAFDFIEKPLGSEKLLVSIQRCLEHQALKTKVRELERYTDKQEYIGDSPSSKKLIESAKTVAASDATVLLQGESGTGKELIAKIIHDNSKRKNNPFIKINCSALPENLIESELFGYEKGAFTGAVSNKKGVFELANKGTLLLDEIADMGLSAQTKILRAIQNREIQRLGSEQVIKIDVRIIAATHKDLKAEVEKGTFREDLYYRVVVVPITTIPLRERPEEIPILATWFLKRFCEKNDFKLKKISVDAMEQLKKYSWPGNVRELQNLVERMVIMGSEVIEKHELPDFILNGAVLDAPLSDDLSLEEFKSRSERNYVIRVLKKTQGNISKAAKILGMERTNLHKKISQLDIKKAEYF